MLPYMFASFSCSHHDFHTYIFISHFQTHLFEKIDFERVVVATREGSVHPYEDDVSAKSLRNTRVFMYVYELSLDWKLLKQADKKKRTLSRVNTVNFWYVYWEGKESTYVKRHSWDCPRWARVDPWAGLF